MKQRAHVLNATILVLVFAAAAQFYLGVRYARRNFSYWSDTILVTGMELNSPRESSRATG